MPVENMMTMPLRGNRHKIKLIKINEPFLPQIVFGLSYPGTHSEANVNRTEQAPLSPRIEDIQTIDIPLPLRQQTILYYQVSPQVQRILSGIMSLQNTGNQNAFRQDVEVLIGKPHHPTLEQVRLSTTISSDQNLRASKAKLGRNTLHTARFTG